MDRFIKFYLFKWPNTLSKCYNFFSLLFIFIYSNPLIFTIIWKLIRDTVTQWREQQELFACLTIFSLTSDFYPITGETPWHFACQSQRLPLLHCTLKSYKNPRYFLINIFLFTLCKKIKRVVPVTSWNIAVLQKWEFMTSQKTPLNYEFG